MEIIQQETAGLHRQFVQERMNRKIIHILAASLLIAAADTAVFAQEYIAPQVVVSKEKVRSGGKVYYSHVVQERQTLYSISKAYGVTIAEIYESNPEKLAQEVLAEIPIDPELATMVDQGKVEEYETDALDELVHRVEEYKK